MNNTSVVCEASPTSTMQNLKLQLLEGGDGSPAALRQALKTAQLSLDHRFRRDEDIETLVLERAAVVDQVLTTAWCSLGLGDRPEIALIAVGGYGRGELHPGSDVDILILLAEGARQRFGDEIQKFIAVLWDIGIDLGHSVRTVGDCFVTAKEDITISTNLMEARLVSGPAALFHEMKRRTGRDAVWPSRAFFEAKWAEQQERHHKFHDTAYNLEPNIKEGPGGLRDIQMIGWVAKRHFGAASLHELVDHGFLNESEFRSLRQGQRFLWRVRYALHLVTKRREDRLLFDYQSILADRFGHTGDDANLAVEQFMNGYYRTIMELSQLNEMLLELFQEAILLDSNGEKPVPINRRFQTVNGFLEVCDEGIFRRYPFALLELFLILQQHPGIKGVRASTIRLVRDHRYLINDTFRRDIRSRSLFLEILRQPQGLTHELHRMHRYGVLGRYLPEFEAVVGRMQYDLFHTYTVDEHSLKVVGNVRAYAIEEHRQTMPMCAEIFDRLPKPELLYIAALYHDLAKGRGGDHSELGCDLAMDFCISHGLGPYDARLVSWLVRHHLLMSVTAQRKDISDPDVVTAFAGVVGDRIHLDYLYLLTIADIRGTNPNLWNDWKDTLLRDLYLATARAFWRGLENPIDRNELIAETQARAREGLTVVGKAQAEEIWATLGEDYFLRHTGDEIAWHTEGIAGASRETLPLVLTRNGRGGTEVFVYARDQEFLFAATTSVLGRLGLNILDSRIITAENGMTMDSYVVHDTHTGGPCDPERLRDVASTLRAALQNPATARKVDSRMPRRQLRHFSIPTQVHFGTDADKGRTVMEVVARDRPGLLARIGWALADQKVRLQNAKIGTIGERAEDVFFVSDSRNRPLDPARFGAIRKAVMEAVDEGQ
ncbi:MAG TPA: [protein-PII] uridylyltransferase [Gammaproteobacteria bacterium]